jgi:imidazolonepropionase-like amidohydrolase
VSIHDWRETLDLERYDNTRADTADHMWESARRDLREMRDAGVLILAGTDVPILTVPGFALVDEIELLVTKIGFTPLDALRTASINPALYFHAEADFGTVAPGKRADLVVLDDNPLADIANLRRISAVVRAGRLYDRSELDALLRSAERGR